jgi:hypothetical protein
MKTNFPLSLLLLSVALTFTSCEDDAKPSGVNPDTAAKQTVDRFSASAGMLMVRSATNGLPAANAPIDFDKGPFITKGYGPAGTVVEYYNFDVHSTIPAPIYVPMNNGKIIEGQLNIIEQIPGDAGYNDFWVVNAVEVPADFVANSVTSLADIQAKGYPIKLTTNLVNCPVVPEGSTATKRLGSGGKGLVRGWYKGKIVSYFTFEEKALMGSAVPLSPIFVTFNINPDKAGGGPPSGFKDNAGLTHNVLQTLPADAAYSPLWIVNVYDNADFDKVSNIATAKAAKILGSGVANVNCPVVSQQ